MFASLVAILVADVNFHAHHPIAESFQRSRHDGLDVSRQPSTAIDVVIGVNLNLHSLFPSIDGLDDILAVDEHKLGERFLVKRLRSSVPPSIQRG